MPSAPHPVTRTLCIDNRTAEARNRLWFRKWGEGAATDAESQTCCFWYFPANDTYPLT